MATVTRPTDALPDPGDALKAEPIRDHIANILTFIESNNIDSSNVDYSSTDGIMVLDQAQTVTGAKNFSTSILLSGSATVDLNGIADSLILDEDADTTISAPTDDQIDIEVGGSDLYKFTATAFVSGSNIVSDTTNTDSLGTTALTWSDLYLGDASVLAFGEDQDVTLTHDPDDGIFLNAGMKLGFRDMGGEYIYSVSDGTLGIAAATEVDITTTTLDVNGAVDISGATAIGGTLNVGASTAIANVKDEDNMSSNSATSLATQQSIKAYVDSQVAGADTLTELTDTNITSAADASMLLYDTGTSRWIDNVMSGDATMADTGAVTLAGTNTNLTTLANVTTVGTIGTGTWQGNKVASAYLDDQTAHLNGTQSFTGAKTFGAASQFNSTITVGADDAGYDVIFYGNTASANATWDTSADDLILSGAAGLIVPDGQLTLGSTAVTSTAAELNLIDGATSRGTTAVASGDGILINDAGTMRMTNVDTVSTYFSSHSVGGSNIVTVGTVGTGTWQGTKVASAYLDDQTAHLNITQSFTGAKTFGAATQFNSTVTVGVDDTGYDVQLFGATSGSSLLWDQSADDLIFTNAGIAVGSDATGDVYYRDANGFLARLAIGSDGQVLTSTGTVPNWEAAGGGSSGISWDGTTANGVATFKDSDEATVESNLTFDGSTLTVTGDQHIANGSGLVIGNTAQVAVGGVTPEMQVLGTAAADSAMTVGTFSADAASPLFYFIKSRAGSIGAGASASNAADDGDRLGQIIWCVDDGTDYQHDGARIWAEAEGDATSNNIPTSLHFGTCPSGASTIAERMRIDSAGRVGFNISPVPTAFNTLGVVIDQKTGDDDVLSFRSTGDITQAMTDLADTACYGQFRKASATAGALQITGFGEGNGGLYLFGRQGSEDTSDASGSIGAVYCQSSKASGTSVAAISDSGNLFAVGNGGTCRMLIKGNGVMHISNTTLVALDEEDDIGLVRAFQKASSKGMGVVMSKWDEVMKENEDDLRRVGVLSSESDFVIQQNFNSLIGGSVWQLYTKLQDTKEFYENKIAALESRLMRLEK